MKHRISFILGKFFALLYLAAEALLFSTLERTNLVPPLYLGVSASVLILLTALVIWLTWSGRYRIRYVIGILLAILFTGLYTLGFRYVNRTLEAADRITAVNTEIAEVGVYIREENTDSFSQTAGGYSYGILSSLDRENTDHAVTQLKEELSISFSPMEYDSLTDLIDALLDEEIDAVILNSAYLDVLEDLEGYENIRSQIKEATITQIASEIEASQVSSIAERGDTDILDDAPAAFTLYISGVDSRSSELVSKSRSDVNIIAAVNTETHQIVLVSTPRDYYVPLSISNGIPDKLTHAGIYGVQVSMDTLAMLYEVNIDYYFRVNFSGFKNIIDALGGITVISDYDFDTHNQRGYHFTKGENELNGAEALAFCRERYSFATGDNQRGRNQLAVIKGVLNKCLSADLLLNFTQVLNAVENSFETSVPYSVISSLVRSQLTNGSDWNIVSYSVTGTGDNQVPYSMSQSVYVMVPNESTVATAKELIQTVLNGGTVTTPQ